MQDKFRPVSQSIGTYQDLLHKSLPHHCLPSEMRHPAEERKKQCARRWPSPVDNSEQVCFPRDWPMNFGPASFKPYSSSRLHASRGCLIRLWPHRCLLHFGAQNGLRVMPSFPHFPLGRTFARDIHSSAVHSLLNRGQFSMAIGCRPSA